MRRTAFVVAMIALTWPAIRYVGAQAPARRIAGAQDGEWRTYGGDLRHSRYAALDQINASNFNNLQVAWQFKTDNLGPRPETSFQATPLVVHGMMYSTAGTRRAVVALDAATGELRWMHAIDEGKRAEAAPRRLSGRGLAYWSDGREERVLYVTPGYRLIALDAKTGARIQNFGNGGIVDLREGLDQDIDPQSLDTLDIGFQSAPIVAQDVVLIGAAHNAGTSPKSRKNVKGYIRGFDVRTGRRLWVFHTIPKPGEFGFDSWDNPVEAIATGNAGSWAQMSADEELGLVYVGVEIPTGDWYGGHRHGNGLFGESIVALDIKTGKRKWHYQMVHHGIWDMDVPCAAVLADLTVNGRTIKALAQPTKHGFVFVLDRLTGAPVWPIEERPVPQSTVPGEKTSPTQPFPTKPPAFARQGITPDDLVDFTPELKAEALKSASRFQFGPLFTPMTEIKPGGPLGTLMFPSGTGGANWPGASLDPETNYLYLFANNELGVYGLSKPGANQSDEDFIVGRLAVEGGGGEGGYRLTIQGMPAVKPPWGQITAIDLNKGEIVWKIAHGETPDSVRNNAAFKGVTIPRTGRLGRIGVLVTKTLLIAGEGGTFTLPDGRKGAMLRAYDKATGNEVGAVYMPSGQTGSPMTYVLNGTQYITLAIAGPGFGAELLTFKLGK